jgi:hypothetical protein
MNEKEYLLNDLDKEIQGIDPMFLQRWDKYKVSPSTITCKRTKDYGNENIYIVARYNNEVILYDDVEEEIGMGIIDPDGLLREWSILGSLDTCIKCFPGGSYYE